MLYQCGYVLYIFSNLWEDFEMTTRNYPPISPGTAVETTQPNWSLRKEWTDSGWASRQWGIQGRVLTHHDSHGLCYDVRHEDGTKGCYDPSELKVVAANT